MIAWNTPLPVQVSEIFHSAKDYFSSALFEIASRKSPLDIPNIIARLELKETLMAKKDAARVTVTFAMDASLSSDISRQLFCEYIKPQS
jgi:molecular chaperone DnaK (HSP70)